MKRILAFVLLALAAVSTTVLCMTTGVFAAEIKGPIADADSSDSYVGSLLSSLPDESSNIGISTREAGRLWADKTVTSNRGGGIAQMDLDMQTDGYSGEVSTDDSFLTTFSVLGSAINIYGEAQNPLDVVFLLDMSGSMGTDVYENTPGHSSSHANLAERISHSRIGVTLAALNKAIEQVMETNESSRVGVVGYGATGAEILPLAHYEKKNGQDYLTVDNFTSYTSANEQSKDWSGSSGFTVHADVTKVTFAPDGTKQYSDFSSATRNTYRRLGKGNPTYVGFHTNLQVGIRLGFDQLYNAYQSADDVMWSYHSKVYGRDVTLRRVPIAFVMTDGGANYSLKEPSAPTAGNGDEYQTQPITDLEDSSDAYDRSLGFYRAEVNGQASQALILNNLLTASFMKSKVENRYAHFCEEANVLLADENADFIIHTVSVDTPDSSSSGYAREVPRVYSSLDPEHFFKPASELKQVGSVDPQSWSQINDIDNAYKDWQAWLAAPLSSSITSNIYSCTTWSTIHTKINTLPEGGWTDGQGTVITKEDMERNLYYNDGFSDVTATNLSSIFTNEISRVGKLNTTPVSGLNDLGVEGSATFADPLGLHMETHDVKSVLLFGKMHDLTCQGIHDHSFIDAYNARYPQGFKQGWYSTDDGTSAEYLGDSGHTWQDAFYFLDCDTAKQLIPNIAISETEKQQDTRFVAYGIQEDDASLWRINPAMLDWWNEGEYDPDTLMPNLQDGHGNGIYRLSDIKVWTEDTGAYEDTGDIVVDGGYDRALYVNVPAAAIPLQTVDVRLDTKEQVIYCETNLGSDHPEAADAYYKQSTPLRVFYSVGLSGEVLDDDGEFDYRKVDHDYLAAHTDADGWVSFYSNYFSNSTWDHYGTGDPVSLGNAALTFSPSSTDRYYVTQNALPIYKLVSYSGEEIPKDSDWWDGIPCGAIEDNPTWDAASRAKAWDEAAIQGAQRNNCTISRVTSSSDMESEAWYFVLIDYYAGKDSSHIDHMYRLVPRQGKEFGSGVGGTEVRAGAYLCWTDPACDRWEAWTVGSSPSQGHENWTIGLRPGADRVGDLAQSKIAKGVDDDGNSNNVTGTSENRMIPTISEASTSSDFIINTYMGNNGKLEFREYFYFAPEVQKQVVDTDGAVIDDWDFTTKPFQFTLSSTDDYAPLPEPPTVETGEDGIAKWGELRLERGKTYHYTVQESSGAIADVQYDAQPHTLTVTVADDGTVTQEWDGSPLGDGQMTVTNTYASKTSLALNLQKKYVEKDTDEDLEISDGQFSFTLSPADTNPDAPMPGAEVAGTDTAGEVRWGDIVFDRAGEWDYIVTENDPEDGDIIWDEKEHKVHVSVTRNPDHMLTASWTWDGTATSSHPVLQDFPTVLSTGSDYADAVDVRSMNVSYDSSTGRLHASVPAYELEHWARPRAYVVGYSGLLPDTIDKLGLYQGESVAYSRPSELTDEQKSKIEIKTLATLHKDQDNTISVSSSEDAIVTTSVVDDSHISVEIDVPIEDCLFNLSDGSYALGLKLFSDDAEAWFVELPITKCGLIDNNGFSPTITNYHYDPVHLPSTGSTGIIATLQSGAALCAVGITGALLSKRRSKKTESYKPKHLSKK